MSYEKADWRAMSDAAAALDVPQSIIAQKYFECVESVNAIWTSLTNSNEETME